VILQNMERETGINSLEDHQAFDSLPFSGFALIADVMLSSTEFTDSRVRLAKMSYCRTGV
jgi:hypothetical protein